MQLPKSLHLGGGTKLKLVGGNYLDNLTPPDDDEEDKKQSDKSNTNKGPYNPKKSSPDNKAKKFQSDTPTFSAESYLDDLTGAAASSSGDTEDDDPPSSSPAPLFAESSAGSEDTEPELDTDEGDEEDREAIVSSTGTDVSSFFDTGTSKASEEGASKEDSALAEDQVAKAEDDDDTNTEDDRAALLELLDSTVDNDQNLLGDIFEEEGVIKPAPPNKVPKQMFRPRRPTTIPPHPPSDPLPKNKIEDEQLNVSSDKPKARGPKLPRSIPDAVKALGRNLPKPKGFGEAKPKSSPATKQSSVPLQMTNEKPKSNASVVAKSQTPKRSSPDAYPVAKASLSDQNQPPKRPVAKTSVARLAPKKTPSMKALPKKTPKPKATTVSKSLQPTSIPNASNVKSKIAPPVQPSKDSRQAADASLSGGNDGQTSKPSENVQNETTDESSADELGSEESKSDLSDRLTKPGDGEILVETAKSQQSSNKYAIDPLKDIGVGENMVFKASAPDLSDIAPVSAEAGDDEELSTTRSTAALESSEKNDDTTVASIQASRQPRLNEPSILKDMKPAETVVKGSVVPTPPKDSDEVLIRPSDIATAKSSSADTKSPSASRESLKTSDGFLVDAWRDVRATDAFKRSIPGPIAKSDGTAFKDSVPNQPPASGSVDKHKDVESTAKHSPPANQNISEGDVSKDSSSSFLPPVETVESSLVENDYSSLTDNSNTPNDGTASGSDPLVTLNEPSKDAQPNETIVKGTTQVTPSKESHERFSTLGSFPIQAGTPDIIPVFMNTRKGYTVGNNRAPRAAFLNQPDAVDDTSKSNPYAPSSQPVDGTQNDTTGTTSQNLALKRQAEADGTQSMARTPIKVGIQDVSPVFMNTRKGYSVGISKEPKAAFLNQPDAPGDQVKRSPYDRSPDTSSEMPSTEGSSGLSRSGTEDQNPNPTRGSTDGTTAIKVGIQDVPPVFMNTRKGYSVGSSADKAPKPSVLNPQDAPADNDKSSPYGRSRPATDPPLDGSDVDRPSGEGLVKLNEPFKDAVPNETIVKGTASMKPEGAGETLHGTFPIEASIADIIPSGRNVDSTGTAKATPPNQSGSPRGPTRGVQTTLNEPWKNVTPTETIEKGTLVVRPENERTTPATGNFPIKASIADVKPVFMNTRKGFSVAETVASKSAFLNQPEIIEKERKDPYDVLKPKNTAFVVEKSEPELASGDNGSFGQEDPRPTDDKGSLDESATKEIESTITMDSGEYDEISETLPESAAGSKYLKVETGGPSTATVGKKAQDVEETTGMLPSKASSDAVSSEYEDRIDATFEDDSDLEQLRSTVSEMGQIVSGLPPTDTPTEDYLDDASRQFDEAFMQLAVALALVGTDEHKLPPTHPKPPVGAVLVSNDGTILGEGTGSYEADAVQMVLEQAGLEIKYSDQWEITPPREFRELLSHSTLYVTLEPSSKSHGSYSLPPVTELIVVSGISRVIIGSLDPVQPTQGVKLLQDAGIVVSVGEIAAEDCDALVEEYVALTNSEVQCMARDHFSRLGRPLGLLHCSVVDVVNAQAFASHGNAFSSTFGGATLSFSEKGKFEFAKPPRAVWAGEEPGSPEAIDPAWYAQADAVVVSIPRYFPNDDNRHDRLSGLTWLARHRLPANVERVVVLDAADLQDLPLQNGHSNLPPDLDVTAFWAGENRRPTRLILRYCRDDEIQKSSRAAQLAAQQAADAAALVDAAMDAGDFDQAAEFAQVVQAASQRETELMEAEVRKIIDLQLYFEDMGVRVDTMDEGEPVDVLKHLGETSGHQFVVWRASDETSLSPDTFQVVCAHMAVRVTGGTFWQTGTVENAVEGACKSPVEVLGKLEQIGDIDQTGLLRHVRLNCRVDTRAT